MAVLGCIFTTNTCPQIRHVRDRKGPLPGDVLADAGIRGCSLFLALLPETPTIWSVSDGQAAV